MPSSPHAMALAMLTGSGGDALPGALRTPARRVRSAALPWLAAPGVQGLGVGWRRVSGRETGEPALVLFVERKCAPIHVRGALPPRELSLPGLEGRVVVDVQEIGRLRRQDGPAPGARICRQGLDASSSGTLGCLVHRRSEPQVQYLLSNAHVLAWAGGSPPVVDEPILYLDGGGARQVATLTDWTRFSGGTGLPNVADAAIARVDPAAGVSPSVGMRGAPQGPSTFVTEGMAVHLHGAASQRADGRVRSSRFTATFWIGGQSYGFSDLVLCEAAEPGGPFTRGGDSGSLVMNSANQAIGLHMAGSETTGVFCRIRNVLDLLDVEVTTGTATTVPAAPALRAAPGAAPPLAGSDDLDILARTLWGEARGEEKAGREAVACVVLNRARTRPPAWWGSTVAGVCRKPFQFSCWNPGDPNREKLLAVRADEDAVFRECLDIAGAAVAGRLPDVTHGATHYHTMDVLPAWARGRQPCFETGRHRFYHDVA